MRAWRHRRGRALVALSGGVDSAVVAALASRALADDALLVTLTGAAVPALIAAGVKPGKPQIRKAVSWLESVQNDDGGWGEDLRSYDDPANWSGRGASTASQTAWALLALLAAGERDGKAVERGLR